MNPPAPPPATEITARLDELYATEPSELDPALQRAQRRSLLLTEYLVPECEPSA